MYCHTIFKYDGNVASTKYHITRTNTAHIQSKGQKVNISYKGKGVDTCCSAAYMSQTRDQQRFTISEVAADWQELMVPQRIMWPSIAGTNGQLDPWCS